MSKHKKDDPQEVVDMELNCLRCGVRLYLPVPQAEKVVRTVEQNGTAILICVCGAAQSIRSRLNRPIYHDMKRE